MIGFKPYAVIGGIAGVAMLGLFIQYKIVSYGNARYDAGIAACEKAVAEKASETKDKLDRVQTETEEEADKTRTVYVDVVREVAVKDATLIAENNALRNTLKRLKEENQNAPVDNSVCAGTGIPDDSLRVHSEIDRLLRSD